MIRKRTIECNRKWNVRNFLNQNGQNGSEVFGQSTEYCLNDFIPIRSNIRIARMVPLKYWFVLFYTSHNVSIDRLIDVCRKFERKFTISTGMINTYMKIPETSSSVLKSHLEVEIIFQFSGNFENISQNPRWGRSNKIIF